MKNSPGWFDFADFYDFIVGKFDCGVFVEIGTWKGQSITYLASKIKQQNKKVTIFGIDTFLGTPGEHDDDIDVINATLYETYLKNIAPHTDIIKTVIGDSHQVYESFEDESIDFLFIDGDHHYESVKTDLTNWFPKIRSGGIISGHDYTEAGECGVIPAVNEFFFPAVSRMGSSVWYYEKL